MFDPWCDHGTRGRSNRGEFSRVGVVARLLRPMEEGQEAQTRTRTIRASASAVHTPLRRQIPSRRYGIPRSGIVVAQNDTTGVVTPLGPTRASGRAGKGASFACGSAYGVSLAQRTS